MEKKVSAIDEARLTRAIEKAASLAAVNDTYNRSKLLADQLRQEQVDKRFAKTAAAAFNKRLTVLTLSKTADEHKADSFELADANDVYTMLGGEPEMKKTASVQQDYVAFVTPKGTMKKTASEKKVVRPNYEDTVTVNQLLDHLENMLVKQAAEFSELSGKWQSLDSSIKEQQAQLKAELSKEANAFVAHTIGRIYGQDAAELVDAPLQKSASVMQPVGGIYDKVKNYMEKKAALENIGCFLDCYREGLAEFGKTAAVFNDTVEKLAFNGKLDKTASIIKEALEPDTKKMLLDSAVARVAGSAETGINLGKALIGNGYYMGTQSINDSLKRYYAGRDIDVSPGRVLDAEFINRDRMRDRMLAWSDMSADPALAMYPSSQLFQATHKAMNTDLSLERPDKRELLRSGVGQLLAQNNRQSTADIAALSTTLKQLAQAQSNAATEAATPVYAMDKVKAPEFIEYTPMETKYEMKDSEILKDWADRYKEYDKENTKKDEEAAKKLKEKQEKEQDKAKEKEDKREAAEKALTFALIADRFRGYRLEWDANGHIRTVGGPHAGALPTGMEDRARELASRLYDQAGDKAMAFVKAHNINLH